MNGDVRSATALEGMIGTAVARCGGPDRLVTVVGGVSTRGPFG